MKIRNITGLLCLLAITQFSFGQITLQHTYPDPVCGIYRQTTDPTALKYGMLDKREKAYVIYNLNNSVYKTVELDIRSGMVLYDAGQLCTNVINTDQLVEFYYTVTYKDTEDNDVYISYIINEDGELIRKLEDVRQISLLHTNNGFRLVVIRMIKSNDYCDIYSLPTVSNVPSVQEKSASLPYPNPAEQAINIPYRLSGRWGTISIYTSAGQLMEQRNIDNSSDHLLLDVSGYAKGMYYYKLDKQKGEFMVK